MEGLIYIIAAAVVVAFLFSSGPKRGATYVGYRRIGPILTPAERSFYGVLKQAVDGKAEIFSKVRVADVLAPEKGHNRSRWQTAFNQISRKHFDFVLCNPTDMSVFCCIELNDKSHKHADRKGRDRFLKYACESAGLPLVFVGAKRKYGVTEMREMVGGYVPGLVPDFTSQARDESIDEEQDWAKPEFTMWDQDTQGQGASDFTMGVGPGVEEPEEVDVKVCPKCSSELVKRTAKKGVHKGKEFWACSSYPNCRYIEAISPN